MSASIRVLLADDHSIVRQGIRTMLERDGFQVVGEADDGREAIRLARQLRPDVALLDLVMPLLNGIDSARGIRRVSPRTRSVLLTMYDDPHRVLSALRAGVVGWILKSRAVHDLEQAIREVHRGGAYLNNVSRELLDAYAADRALPTDALTPREREVLQLVAEGKSSKEVACVLGIATRTAECHRGRIMGKLGVHQTASLVRYAIRLGLIQP